MYRALASAVLLATSFLTLFQPVASASPQSDYWRAERQYQRYERALRRAEMREYRAYARANARAAARTARAYRYHYRYHPRSWEYRRDSRIY